MAATTVLATFSVLKDHVKLKVTQDSVAIDNIVFKLHYRATFLILLICSLLVSSRQFFGEHIRCVASIAVAEHVINTFCFFMSTYTVVKHMNATSVELGVVPHPGVGPATKDDPIVHHAYYQWVPFVLFFQAIVFYVPHYLWRNAEGQSRYTGCVMQLERLVCTSCFVGDKRKWYGEIFERYNEVSICGSYSITEDTVLDKIIGHSVYLHISNYR